jgi:hypothetical protein
MFNSKFKSRLNSKFFVQLSFSAISSTCLLIGLASFIDGAIAQVTKPTTESQQALQELRQDNSGNIFGSNNGSVGLLQLIHNANLLNGKSPDKFRSEQAESLDQSVKQFRQRQQSGNSALTTTDPVLSKTK